MRFSIDLSGMFALITLDSSAIVVQWMGQRGCAYTYESAVWVSNEVIDRMTDAAVTPTRSDRRSQYYVAAARVCHSHLSVLERIEKDQAVFDVDETCVVADLL